jgi:uncharacterized protein YcfJ
MSQFKKILMAGVTLLTLGSALGVSTAPASARDAGPVIAGALGGFAAGALLGNAFGHGSAPYGGGSYPAYPGGYGYNSYPAGGYHEAADVDVQNCYVRRHAIYDSWGEIVGYRRIRVCD